MQSGLLKGVLKFLKGKGMNILEQFNSVMKDKDITNVGAFLAGETDCIKGNAHKRGCHPDYDRGYGSRYALEQMLTARASR